VQKVRISWERGHPARGWPRKTRKMRAGCPRSQGISALPTLPGDFHQVFNCKGFYTGMNIRPNDSLARWNPLLKSAMQKCVRRGLVVTAVKCAKSLIMIDPASLCRRLGIISIEDVILHPDIPSVVDLYLKLIQGYEKLSDDEEYLILKVVSDLAAAGTRDDFFLPNKKIDTSGYDRIDASALNINERRLIECLLTIIRKGCTGSDKRMLKKYAEIWYERFTSGQWTASNLRNFFPSECLYDFKTFTHVIPMEIPLEAVDCHCSPILEFLLGKPEVEEIIKTHFGDADSKNVIREIIWRMRSSVSPKTQITKGRPLDWFLDMGMWNRVFGREKFEIVYYCIKEEIDLYSQQYINEFSEAPTTDSSE
jgi:hypothetical protein